MKPVAIKDQIMLREGVRVLVWCVLGSEYGVMTQNAPATSALSSQSPLLRGLFYIFPF